jgi:hypothetical protein
MLETVQHKFDPALVQTFQENAYAHCSLRCQERYGVGLKKKEYQALCQALETETEPFVEWQLKLRDEWHAIISHRGKRCRVVWHPRKRIIRSFLPPLH